MKRFGIFTLTFCLCSFLTGCGGDSHEGLISDTIALLRLASTEVGNISKRVNEAVTNYNKELGEQKPAKLDLAEAIKTTEVLKKHGEKAQEIKQRIEKIRGQLSDDQKKENAKKFEKQLNDVVQSLLDERAKLRVALDGAEKINLAAKMEVDKLRKKISEAESPFESLSRPQQ